MNLNKQCLTFNIHLWEWLHDCKGMDNVKDTSQLPMDNYKNIYIKYLIDMILFTMYT